MHLGGVLTFELDTPGSLTGSGLYRTAWTMAFSWDPDCNSILDIHLGNRYHYIKM